MKGMLPFPFVSSDVFLEFREVLQSEEMRRRYIKHIKSSSHMQRNCQERLIIPDSLQIFLPKEFSDYWI